MSAASGASLKAQHGSSSSSKATTRPEYSIPIPERDTPPAWLQTALFAAFFNLTIIFTHITQFLVCPLYVLPVTRPYFERVISFTKLTFGKILVAITQLFGPTKLVITYELPDGTKGDINDIIRRNKKGDVTDIELPPRSIWMSNHQVYIDWLELWIVSYYANLAGHIIIILKGSLKHIPFIGWGMQFFRFIFMARSWAADQGPLGKHLRAMSKSRITPGAKAEKLLLLIYPEGTLVSKLTRPTSKKFADKVGIQDCRNLLLPRSTGLLFCLRELLVELDDLKLVDFTVGYPGIPAAGYGQSWYTLRSVYMQGVPPPFVHIHLSILDASKLPVGALSRSSGGATGSTAGPGDATEEEKVVFDEWVRNRWRQKDDLLDRFYADGDFVGGAHARAVAAGTSASGQSNEFAEIPVRLRSNWEFLGLFSSIPIVGAAWGAAKAFQAVRA